ncbi:MAG: hypothetical protein Q8913_06565, partial [Bacteroidota bacterium]|nr:hypothetical protein [Bacteroidota bacterium]
SSGGPIISYQGTITNSDGSPGDGSFRIAVSLWTAEIGGSQIWSDEFVTQVTQGVFNLSLGTGKALPKASDMDKSLRVSVGVNGGVPLHRTRLGAVPLAMNVADSSITSAKLATDYVGSISINGQKVTGNGTSLNIAAGNGIEATYDPVSSSLLFALDKAINSKGAKVQTWDNANGGSGNVSAGTMDFLGGGFNNTIKNRTASGGKNTLTGGEDNYIETNVPGGDTNVHHNFIGGGQLNTIYGFQKLGFDGWDGDELNPVITHNTIGGGQDNTIYDIDPDLLPSGDNGNHRWNFIGGGHQNRINGDASVIGGGDTNVIDRTTSLSVIGGGEFNSIGNFPSEGDTDAVISGGRQNTITGSVSAIAGGANLKLGKYSFGFNADQTTSPPKITNLSDSTQIAYFGNVDLMLGNVDNRARKLKFYAANTSLTYNLTGALFSSFRAGAQSYSYDYTLPIDSPKVGRVLAVKTLGSGGAGTPYPVALEWKDVDTGTGGGNFWSLTGNSGTTTPTNFIGTLDSMGFEIHIHNNTLDTSGGNQRVMRYEEGTTSPNIVGGSSANTIAPGLSGAAILSGGSILQPNILDSVSDFSVIAGGRNNYIQGPYNAISGGDSNRIALWTDHNWIGGGFGNIEINESFGGIAGGYRNLLDSDAWEGFIGNGQHNYIGTPMAFIGSGYDNAIWHDPPTWSNPKYSGAIVAGHADTIHNSAYSIIGDGEFNMINSAWYSAIGSGSHNLIDSAATYAAVSGGEKNAIGKSADHAVIAGGDSNMILSSISTIAGGRKNVIGASSDYSTISGGDSNHIDTVGGTIAGGQSNAIASPLSTVGGGFGNRIMTDTTGLSIIAGGGNNRIDTNAFLSSISGGQFNAILSPVGTMGGGIKNRIDTAAFASTISGGDTNTIRARYSTIGGGLWNLIDRQQVSSCWCSSPASVGVIAGGVQDTIGWLDGRWIDSSLLDALYASPIMAAISGGYKNTVNGHYGAVGGGYENHATGEGAAIPGGIGLEAYEFQTVVGKYNANLKRTQYHISPLVDTLPSIGDLWTFVVGNGTSADSAHRSNAFEVSDNGHSIVHDSLGNGTGGPPRNDPIQGATYKDNVINAWGDVPGTSAIGVPIYVPNSFGIATGAFIQHLGLGLYQIRIDCYNSDGTNRTLTTAAINVTVEENGGEGCGYATVSRIAGNSFFVHTYNGMGSGCSQHDRDFFFTVVGR